MKRTKLFVLSVSVMFGAVLITVLNTETYSKDENILLNTDRIYHIVQPGESLGQISLLYLGSMMRYNEILELNGLDNSTLYVGQRLYMPLETKVEIQVETQLETQVETQGLYYFEDDLYWYSRLTDEDFQNLYFKENASINQVRSRTQIFNYIQVGENHFLGPGATERALLSDGYVRILGENNRLGWLSVVENIEINPFRITVNDMFRQVAYQNEHYRVYGSILSFNIYDFQGEVIDTWKHVIRPQPVPNPQPIPNPNISNE